MGGRKNHNIVETQQRENKNKVSRELLYLTLSHEQINVLLERMAKIYPKYFSTHLQKYFKIEQKHETFRDKLCLMFSVCIDLELLWSWVQMNVVVALYLMYVGFLICSHIIFFLGYSFTTQISEMKAEGT